MNNTIPHSIRQHRALSQSGNVSLLVTSLRGISLFLCLLLLQQTVFAPKVYALQTPPEKTLYLKQDANMRQGPGADFKVETVLLKGEEVLERYRKALWVAVDYPKKNLKGWIHRDLLAPHTPSGQPMVEALIAELKKNTESNGKTLYLTKDTNIRKGPGAEYNSIVVAQKGEEVVTQAKKNSWVYIKIPRINLTGWISENQLTPTQGPQKQIKLKNEGAVGPAEKIAVPPAETTEKGLSAPPAQPPQKQTLKEEEKTPESAENTDATSSEIIEEKLPVPPAPPAPVQTRQEKEETSRSAESTDVPSSEISKEKLSTTLAQSTRKQAQEEEEKTPESAGNTASPPPSQKEDSQQNIPPSTGMSKQKSVSSEKKHVAALPKTQRTTDWSVSQPVRIGVINLQRIIDDSYKGRDLKVYYKKLSQEKYPEELKRIDKKLIDEILSDIKIIVGKYARKHGITHVINQNVGSLFYSEDQFDITNDIIDLYDSEYQKEQHQFKLDTPKGK